MGAHIFLDRGEDRRFARRPLTYAVIAKKMALENLWLNPMLMDEPYLNKPPLFLWGPYRMDKDLLR